jgi:hypothetical protein
MNKDVNLILPTNGLSNGDVWHGLAKVTLGALPVLGPAVAELFQIAIITPAQLRQTQWQIAVAEVLNRLITNVEGLSVENLANNEDFLTTVVATSHMAMKTSQIEKIRMLQAAIYRSGSGLKLQAFIQNTFLQIIERYVPEHVVLLRELTYETSLKNAFMKLKDQCPDLIKTNTTGPESGEYCKIEDLAKFIVEDLPADTASELFADLHRDKLCRGSEGWQLSYYVDAPLDFVTSRGKAFLEYINFESSVPTT